MSDTVDAINCPACGKELKKVFIKSANCNIDICADGCGGIFFDNRELKKFSEQGKDIDEIISAYKDIDYQKVNEDQKRICPVCGANMVKHYASAKYEVELDECYSCGGIFLDYGELEKIRSQYKTEEDRSKAFNATFESQHDTSEFKDYKPKTMNEIFEENLYTIRFINSISKAMAKKRREDQELL